MSFNRQTFTLWWTWSKLWTSLACQWI